MGWMEGVGVREGGGREGGIWGNLEIIFLGRVGEQLFFIIKGEHEMHMKETEDLREKYYIFCSNIQRMQFFCAKNFHSLWCKYWLAPKTVVSRQSIRNKLFRENLNFGKAAQN